MKKVTVMIRIVILFFILVSINVSANVEPIFELEICSDESRINAGDDISFNIYMIGIGDVVNDYFLFYVDSYISIKSMAVMGDQLPMEGLQTAGSNVQIIYNFWGTAKQFFENYSTENINPLYGGTFNESWANYIPAIKVTFSTNEKVNSGEHEINLYYMYKNGNESWKIASNSMMFHVNTLTEEYEVLGFFWNISQAFLGFGFALFLYSLSKKHVKKKEGDEKKKLMDNIALMIKDEIVYNLEKTKQMKKDAQNKNIIPNYRLKTVNKDAGWSHIIRFRSEKRDFINKISELYAKYDLLNRTIDIGTQVGGGTALINEIVRICGKIEQKTKGVVILFNS